MIVTARMRLAPATVALARAERRIVQASSGYCRLRCPTSGRPRRWPTLCQPFLESIEAAPDQSGWFVWYAMIREPGEASDILAASAGFRGPPQDGTVEIGYSALPRFQGRGYATEMVRGLTE